MGKKQKQPQLPAPVPGAVPLSPDPGLEAISELPSTPEAPEVSEPAPPESVTRDPETEGTAVVLEILPTQAMAARRARYRVAHLFQGFREVDLHEGDVVEADEDEAAPYLGKDGVLTRIKDEA